MNLAMDLTRIGEFLCSDSVKLAERFLARDERLYQDMKGKIGRWTVREFLGKLKEGWQDRERTAELAFTGADILMCKSGGLV